jgi:predicted ATPase/DNA-binding XRE family transcriptional regulator
MSEIMSFGEWVQTRRNQLRYSRKGLAELVSCSPVTIKKIERDERRPSPQIAELLAQHLQLPESEHENFMARARGEFVSNFISPTELSLEEAQAPATEEETPKHNLPPHPIPFFGRTQELAEIAHQLADPDCRLLTILGAGGMGKTRLAIEVGMQCAASLQFTDGVIFIELAPIDPNRSEGDINPLATALVDALGISFHGESPPEQQLSDYLSRREMLIVYDNFEHLVETAVFLSDLLSHAPDIKILVTSRERLNLQEEWLYVLPGLPLPAGSDGLPADAGQFFIERAKQVKSSFDCEAELAGIQRICQLVAGMPLGIELSAAWVLQLSCEEIADEIEAELDFLTTEMRNVPDRHRSVRAIWAYSWERLTDKERAVLRKLSVFRGGFERKAAKAVAGASLPILAKLVNKSLLSVGENGRYQIHELLRQFAAEKLAQTPNLLSEAQMSHSSFYLEFLDKHAFPDVETEFQQLAQIEQEIDNIRLSIKHALMHAPNKFTASGCWALMTLYEARGWYLEGAQTMQVIATALQPAYQASQSNQENRDHTAGLTLSAFHVATGFFHGELGNEKEAKKSIQAAMASLPQNKEAFPWQWAFTLWAQAHHFAKHGHMSKAAHWFEKGIAVARELKNLQSLYYHVISDYTTMVLLNTGDFARAQQLISEAYQFALSTGDQRRKVNSLRALGILARIRGDYDEAEKFLKQTLAIAEALLYPVHIILTRYGLGNVARLRKDFPTALDYYQQGIKLATEVNSARLFGGHWHLGFDECADTPRSSAGGVGGVNECSLRSARQHEFRGACGPAGWTRLWVV